MTNRDRRALRRSLCRSAFEAVEGRLITESLVYPEVRVKGSDKVWKGAGSRGGAPRRFSPDHGRHRGDIQVRERRQPPLPLGRRGLVRRRRLAIRAQESGGRYEQLDPRRNVGPARLPRGEPAHTDVSDPCPRAPRPQDPSPVIRMTRTRRKERSVPGSSRCPSSQSHTRRTT
mgnify:CR=1 FL=1